MEWTELPYDLPPALLPEAATALFAALELPGESCRLVQRHTEEPKSSGGPPSAIDMLHDDWFHAELTGPEGKILDLRGMKAYSAFRVSPSTEDDGSAAVTEGISAAWYEVLWRAFASRAQWHAHPSMPPQWEGDARSLVARAAYRFLPPCGRVFAGSSSARWTAVVADGRLLEQRLPLTLAALGPVPARATGQEVQTVIMAEPPPAFALLAVLDPAAPGAVRMGHQERELADGDAAGLFGAVAGGWVAGHEAWSAWRAGAWVVRESRWRQPTGHQSVHLALQHEQGEPLALFLTSVSGEGKWQTYGSILGRDGTAEARAAKAVVTFLHNRPGEAMG